MPEKQNIEWKAKWKDSYLEWICGFANAQGGKIYIGCNDDGKVIGLTNTRKLLEDIPNKIRNAMSIIVDVNLLTEGEKEYIEIVVPPYPVAISCKGVYYYRSGSTMQTLSGPELESFILRKRGASWDSMPLPGFTVNDIDDELVQKFKSLAVKKGRVDRSVLDESKESLMEKLRLTNAGYYTNAAMLLFSKNPDKWHLGAYTKIGFFESDADLRYQDEIHGSILEQVDKVMEVLHLKYMKAKISYEGIQRIERYFVTDEALREALLNALCHKQYESCIPIQISVYEDCLYIANCGKLPENWTVDNLIRGIEKICQSCIEDRSPLPEYTINSGDIMIKFTALEDRLIRSTTQKVGEKVGKKVGKKLSKTETVILNLLHEDPAYSYVTLAQKAGISEKTVFIRIKSLKEKGILERVGSGRKGYWKINE